MKEYVVSKVLNRREARWDHFTALSGIDLQGDGEAVALGLNGSGKSTLLKLIAEQMSPDQGIGVRAGSLA